MKTLLFKTEFIFFLLLMIITSCKREEENINSEIFQTWKFVSFGNSDGTLSIAQPEDCSDCYIMIFNKEDSIMTGTSVINKLGGKFILKDNQLSFPWGVLATEVLEEGDPLSFTEALLNVRSFSIEESNLKLFYLENKFLLCYPINN